MRRRNRKRIGEVVEAAVRGIVAGQQRLHVQIQREQIPNRVVVFGAIQPLHRADAPRIRMRRPRLIHRVLKLRSDRCIGRFIRPRIAQRRHRLRPQLHDHFLDGRRVWPRLRKIQRVQREPRCRSLMVVAIEAIILEELPRGYRRGLLSRHLLSGRLRTCRRLRAQIHRRGRQPRRRNHRRPSHFFAPNAHETSTMAVYTLAETRPAKTRLDQATRSSVRPGVK